MENEIFYDIGQIPLYTRPQEGEEIVISGMSGKFPDSDNISDFRENLFNKVDLVTDDQRRWKINHPELSRRSGKLFDIEKFDAGFFGITHLEGDNTDPLIRMSLERAIEAIMDAGHHPSDLAETNTAVFDAICNSEYENEVCCNETITDANRILGMHKSMIAKRVNYYLKLKNSSFVLDSACAASLYALEEAYRLIRKGKCEKALVIGTQLCLSFTVSLQFARLGALSMDGRCKSFDEAADGYARSEAVVAILLEKAKDAKRNYAEVVYVKSNIDGYKEEGITFPSLSDQTTLMREFYNEVGINPTDVTFVEAHGTGTKAGDPIELKSIHKTFCKERNEPLYIGSVKSNIGHTEGASGLCSIVKVLIGTESGFMPPNIHFKTPREELKNGEMVVVSEKMPLSNHHRLFAINNFGFGGSNAHTLLRRNDKSKTTVKQSKDSIPLLICISGRTREGVTCILDDFKNENYDYEYAYIIQNVYKKAIDNHLYRGFGIYTKEGEMKRSFKKCESKRIYLVFSNFDQEWLKLSYHFMNLPIFANTIKDIQDLVSQSVDVNLPDIFSNLTEENSICRSLRIVIIQIGLANVLKYIKIAPYLIAGIGSGELVAAYMDNYLTLKQTILGLLYTIPDLGEAFRINRKTLESLLHTQKKFITIDEKKLCINTTRYSADNIVTSFNGKRIKPSPTKHEILVVIGPHIEGAANYIMDLVDSNSQNPIIDFLGNLGSLYEYGIDMEIDKLYPNIELPVSRGTPMLSPLIKWDHRRNYNISTFEKNSTKSISFKVVGIALSDSNWEFISGHVIDGRNLFPAAGYLFLVWNCFISSLDRKIEDSRVVFENVQFLRTTNVSEGGHLEMIVVIQSGTNSFSIEESGTIVASGKIREQSEEDALVDLPTVEYDEDSLCLDDEDVYKELKLRGYHHSGKFKKIKKCSVDGSQTVIEWDDNWIAFLDNIVQVLILNKDSRSLYLPTTIEHLVIDAPKCLTGISKYKNKIPLHLYKEIGIMRSEGVELRGLLTRSVRRKRDPEPLLEIYKFIENSFFCEIDDSIRIFLQIVWENSNTVNVKVVEVPENESNDQLLSPMMLTVFKDLPPINKDLTILTNRGVNFSEINVRNNPLKMETNCLIVVVSKVLETQEVSAVLHAIEGVGGFVISRENYNAHSSMFINSPFNVLSSHKCNGETLFLLRQIQKPTRKVYYLNFSNDIDDYKWMTHLQSVLKQGNKAILYAQNDEINGLLGFAMSILEEYSSEEISCFLILDGAPEFNPDLDFYREQLDKNMTVNIWKNGEWGTYRHLLMPENQTLGREHCYANVTTVGDISTFTWLEGHLNKDEGIVSEMELVDVYYSALNFRDLMIASGRLPEDLSNQDRLKQDCLQGLEFCGRDSKGKRVMGICSSTGLASLVMCEKKLLFPIPDNWTMEDAATVTIVYATVIECLLIKCNPTPGESILIHSATGATGQAAINISLYSGLTVFVTVGTLEKRDFIKKHYPQIKDEHIGSSRDTSFELMAYQYTNGRGVDYVLNSLAEDKLLASVRCLAKGGKFLEIGKFDMVNNNTLNLHLLEKEASYLSLTLDIFTPASNYSFVSSFLNLLKCGAVKPLPRTVFEMNEVQEAFRFMGAGKHLGKILIKIRDEEVDKIYSVPRMLFKAKSRFYCKPESSYLICGGLGGFGLELADFLVLRGARKIILTSKSGVVNGYQKYRIKIWRSYGVSVLTTTCGASTEENCRELLDTASKLGPVDGIFNLAMVLKDALFENQTVDSFKDAMIPKAYSTKNLDRISRRICPNLRYFVVFSSIVSGRGCKGQTNYGMTNSVMERICEKRKNEGYPALAIQWGLVKDVGWISTTNRKIENLIVCGAIQQSINSCLNVLDGFLMQNETIVISMVVAEKKM